MIRLGLTGDIACGKSTVARLLEEQGATLIDSDLLVRELYHRPEFAQRVAELFRGRGEEHVLLQADGSVDRAVLGQLVFNDAAALRQLEALVHPAVAALREEKVKTLQASSTAPPAVVFEAVKLIESGQARGCDVVWCVTCEPDVQLSRLMTQRGLSQEAARARLANQPGVAQKRAMLGPVPLVLIPNDGSLEALRASVEQAWSLMRESVEFRNARSGR
jgi:dephospho-CoA kinase